LRNPGFAKARDVTKLTYGTSEEPIEDVFAVDERVDLASLANWHVGTQSCRCLAASITRYSKGVFSVQWRELAHSVQIRNVAGQTQR